MPVTTERPTSSISMAMLLPWPLPRKSASILPAAPSGWDMTADRSSPFPPPPPPPVPAPKTVTGNFMKERMHPDSGYTTGVMFRLGVLGVLTMLAIATARCVGASLPLVDLADENTVIGFRFKEHDQSGRITRLGERPALEVKWDGAQKPHCEFALRKKIPLPDFFRARLSADIYVPETAPALATLLALRLEDRDGEIFQFPKNIPTGVSGWQTLVFELDQSQPPPVSWGGKPANRKIDLPVKIHGLSIGYKNRKSTGTLGLGKVSLDVLSGPLQISLETGNPLHVVKPGEENLLGIRIANPGSEPASATLHRTITFAGDDDAGKTHMQELTLAPATDTLIPLPKPQKHGVYKLRVRLAGNQGQLTEHTWSYGHMPPAGPIPGRAKGFLFGISEHPQWYPRDEQELMARAAAWAGIKVIRDGIDWKKMEPDRGQWKFESFDHFINVFEKYDIEVAPTYPGPLPKWATAADWKPAKPVNRGRPRPDYGYWAEFVRTFAQRYKGRIRFVETWNEPDLLSFANFTPEEYVRLMEIAYKETKKVDPDIQVQSGGFTTFNMVASSTSDTRFMEKSIRHGKAFYDIFAFHGHGPFHRYVINTESVAKLRVSLGDSAPWWANETAISTVHVGEIGQAETLFQKFLYSWAHGAIGYNWYNLRNKGFDPKNNEHNFGLLTRDFYPKPAYATYNMLARYYREGEFTRTLNLGPGLHGYLFRGKSGDYLLANWNGDAATGDVRPVIINGITGKAAVVDLWGNETPVEVVDGALALPVTKRPSTLRITGQTNAPSITGELFMARGEFTIFPGAKRDFTLALTNPTGREIAFNLNFTAPAGISITPARNSVVVSPGQTRDVVFGATAGASSVSKPGAATSVTLDLRAGNLWQGKLDYKVRSITRIPRRDFAVEPDFVLDNASQITSLVVNEPSTAHLFWKGADDLGAKVWLCEKDGLLLLKAIVTDDVHIQPCSGADVWLGDSIQLGLNIPGQTPNWEIGLTHLASGRSEIHIWQTPRDRFAKDVSGKLSLTTRRDDTARQTIYEATIPFASIRLDQDTARRGFGFNLLVNDNDGITRESFISIAPGLGRGKTTDAWPVVATE
ncbi:1,4-beta-xylanase [Opitutaceae bacterium TAV3]|nr:1,4-beta-xylanase [Opitutaceae bacterium TAV3]